MAGDAPHYQRKTTERRDSFKQHRKNSVGRQKDHIQRSTSSSPGGMPFPKPSKGSTHQSVNGFNAQEIEQHLNSNFQSTMRAYHDHSIPERERPEKFSSGEQAWGGKSGVQSAWGDSKACLMASGQDFLAELRKHAS
ncbi:hypothetical protein K450DRAFT_241105 [Umbelopsis ramanniana AG]|uniref:Uncharacterized protein n=1 Tax=Umbelopsis ramanniana AG TaxID=1314678 RepID=A0AAD5HD23_UMBRA|nr:uncharacterized protein K450DRAFT_241105 [Umbelopsis ramanniana AG]KAI8579707.1 hypothetical protein K450DRAFT_241105 [Umbelopsis ramanniana AG]